MANKNSIIIGIIAIIVITVAIVLIWFNFPSEENITNLNLMTPQEKMEADVLSLASNYTFNISELESVEKIKAYGPEVIPVLAKMTNDSRKETRYIAYIALSGLINLYPDKKAELVDYLKNGLTDTYDTVRIQVAQLLLVQGEKEAIPVLIEALPLNILTVPFYAHIILAAHTIQDFGINQDKWLSWWNTNKDKLIWDPKAEKFK